MRRISKIVAEIAEPMGGLCYTFKASVGVRCFQVLFYNIEHLNHKSGLNIRKLYEMYIASLILFF